MQTRIEVGILGATGMVGQHFIRFLQGNPWFDLKWLGASDRSAGKKYRDAMTWHSAGIVPDTITDLIVEECKPGNAPRLLFSAMDASVATEIERAFAQAGHIVVSNSRNHRMERDVPLLVPEINPDHLRLVPGQIESKGPGPEPIAALLRATTEESVRVPAGTFRALRWELQAADRRPEALGGPTGPAAARSGTAEAGSEIYWTARDFPYLLVAWSKPDGGSYRLKWTRRLAYWTLNHPGDESYLTGP